MLETVLIACLGGLVPSIVWLVFWLFEDRCEPEPKLRIAATYLAGMVSVLFVLYLEEGIMPYVAGVPLLICWAVIEEGFKLGAAWIFGLRSKDYNEPLDAVIYMVTAALGFSAAENALFLFTPLQDGQVVQGIITSDLRFLGATLLHTLASTTIGLCMAFAFYKDRWQKREALYLGLILAVVLHTVFNFFILKSGGSIIFSVFLTLWAGIVAVLFFVERVKHPARDYC